MHTTATSSLSTVVVEPIDHDDRALLERAHEVYRHATLHERPWASLWGRENFVQELTTPSPSENHVLLGATIEGDLVGVGLVWLPFLDNLHLAWAGAWVHPDHRRRRAGTALVEAMVQHSLADGRTEVGLEATFPFEERETHFHRRFAESLGFDLGLTQVQRRLDLPVDGAFLDERAAEAAGHHAAYVIETHVNGVPDELKQSLCDALNLLNVEAPSGDLHFEAEAKTPEVMDEELRQMAEQGREIQTTIARDESGRVVAYNDLVIPADPPLDVWQWGTLVVPDARGHRLGMAVKVRGLQELQRRHPERTRVFTSNAEVNAQMVAINVALGFSAYELLGLFHRRP